MYPGIPPPPPPQLSPGSGGGRIPQGRYDGPEVALENSRAAEGVGAQILADGDPVHSRSDDFLGQDALGPFGQIFHSFDKPALMQGLPVEYLSNLEIIEKGRAAR